MKNHLLAQLKIFPLLLLFLIPALHAEDLAYLQSLLKQSRVLKLAKQREWHTLLHYQPSRGGYVSEVDDPQFFNAPLGKTNPQAELEATLRAFFVPPENAQHPQCAFIARYHWLKQQLAFDPIRLPPQPCSRFKEWVAQLQPAGLSLIFPSAYLNNPSSMFGHTLLRIDQQNQTEQTRLLAHALNYAAATEETNGFVFAVKGITGGYPGLFSILPYYKKVKEYSDLENRDLWEYQLNFTPAEVHRLLRHVWELDNIYFDYYFFDENCAYHLLSLLEVARPTLHLRDQFPLWVIPGETVRVIVSTPGILKQAIFRPASATQLRHRLYLLSQEQQDWVLKLVEGRREPNDTQFAALDVTARAKILEVAYDYLYYQHIKAPQSKKTGRLRTLLVARSRLPSTATLSQPPTPKRPDQGHNNFRLTVGLGQNGEHYYQSLRLRPAYHDLLDPGAGYVHGAHINFLDLSLRHQTNNVTVDSLKIIEIVSLAPRDRFFQPLSWKINTGWQRRQGSLVYRTNGGAGLSYQLNANVLGYGFLESTLDIGNALQHYHSLGVGGSVGVFVDAGLRWRMHLYGTTQRFELGHTQTLHKVALEQRLSMSQNSALRLLLSRHYFGKADSHVELSWHWYF